METQRKTLYNKYINNVKLADLEENYVQINRSWEFQNNEPCVVLEYVERKYLQVPIRDQYKVRIWPNNPLYPNLVSKIFTNREITKKAYEFLKDKVYVGYFSDDCRGPCWVHCWVELQFEHTDDILPYVIEVWPDEEEIDYFYFPRLNPDQVRFKGSFN